jgi:hypothetical protein
VEHLQSLFEAIDPELAFVRPLGLLWTQLTRKRNEQRALQRIVDILESIWEERQRSGQRVRVRLYVGVDRIDRETNGD